MRVVHVYLKPAFSANQVRHLWGIRTREDIQNAYRTWMAGRWNMLCRKLGIET